MNKLKLYSYYLCVSLIREVTKATAVEKQLHLLFQHNAAVAELSLSTAAATTSLCNLAAVKLSLSTAAATTPLRNAATAPLWNPVAAELSVSDGATGTKRPALSVNPINAMEIVEHAMENEEHSNTSPKGDRFGDDGKEARRGETPPLVDVWDTFEEDNEI